MITKKIFLALLIPLSAYSSNMQHKPTSSTKEKKLKFHPKEQLKALMKIENHVTTTGKPFTIEILMNESIKDIKLRELLCLEYVTNKLSTAEQQPSRPGLLQAIRAKKEQLKKHLSK